MSVSIATKSLTSILIHTGVNILSDGAPIPVSGLESDLGIKDVKEFAIEVMKIIVKNLMILFWQVQKSEVFNVKRY